MTLHIIFSRTEYHVTMTSQWFSLLIELQSLFAISLEMLFASEVSQKCPSAISRYRGISRRRLFGFLHEGYLILSLFFVRIAS